MGSCRSLRSWKTHLANVSYTHLWWQVIHSKTFFLPTAPQGLCTNCKCLTISRQSTKCLKILEFWAENGLLKIILRPVMGYLQLSRADFILMLIVTVTSTSNVIWVVKNGQWKSTTGEWVSTSQMTIWKAEQIYQDLEVTVIKHDWHLLL